MARGKKLKPVRNRHQQFSRLLDTPYSAERAKKMREAKERLGSSFTELDTLIDRAFPTSSFAASTGLIDHHFPDAASPSLVINQQLKARVRQLDELLHSPIQETDTVAQIVSLQHQLQADLKKMIAETTAKDIKQQLNIIQPELQKNYNALSEQILEERSGIDAMMPAASYFDAQRLKGYQEKSAELGVGINKIIVDGSAALKKFTATFLPAEYQIPQPTQPLVGMPARFEATRTAVKEFDENMRKAVYKYDAPMSGELFDYCRNFLEELNQVIAEIKGLKAKAAADIEANFIAQRVKVTSSHQSALEKEQKLAVLEQQKTAAKAEAVRPFDKNIAVVETEKKKVEELVDSWQKYRGESVVKMQAAARKTLVNPAEQFTIPVPYAEVSQELKTLQASILAASSESAIAQLVMEAASKKDTQIAALLAAPGEPDSPSEKYAQAIRKYLHDLVSPMHILEKCATEQATFKKYYDEIAKDLSSQRFRDDKDYKAAVLQRLKDYRSGIEANARLLNNLIVHNQDPAITQPLKAKANELNTALEGEVKKADDLFEKHRNSVDAANNKLELQIFLWSMQSEETLSKRYAEEYKAQHPGASPQQTQTAIAEYNQTQSRMRSNFLQGQGILEAELENIKKINITQEFETIPSFDFGGITAEMKVTKAGQPIGNNQFGEKTTYDTFHPGTYYIKISDNEPTPEAEQALGRFLKLIAESAKNPPNKPLGGVKLSKINIPNTFLTKASREKYLLERAIYYGKVAADNDVPLRITDPAFTPELQAKYAAAIAGHKAAASEEQAVIKYSAQLSQVADGAMRMVIDDTGAITSSHGVVTKMPDELEAAKFNAVAQLVRRDRMPADDALSQALAAAPLQLLETGQAFLSTAPVPANTAAQALQTQISDSITQLENDISAIDHVAKIRPDLDLSSFLLVARKQWAKIKAANEMLAPGDRIDESIMQRLDKNARKLFYLQEEATEAEEAEAEADKAAALEQARITVQGAVWEEASKRAAKEGIHEDEAKKAFSTLTKSLAAYAKTGTQLGLAYAASAEMRKFSVLLKENDAGGFEQLNDIELLKRFSAIANRFVEEPAAAPPEGLQGVPYPAPVKTILAAISRIKDENKASQALQQQQARRDALEAMPQPLTDALKKELATLTATGDPGSIEALQADLAQAKQIKEAYLADANFPLSTQQLNTLASLHPEELTEFKNLLHNSIATFANVKELQTALAEDTELRDDMVKAIKEAAEAQAALETALIQAYQGIPPEIFQARCENDTLFGPSQETNQTISERLREPLLAEVLKRGAAPLVNRQITQVPTTGADIYHDLNQTIAHWQASYNRLIAAVPLEQREDLNVMFCAQMKAVFKGSQLNTDNEQTTKQLVAAGLTPSGIDALNAEDPNQAISALQEMNKAFCREHQSAILAERIEIACASCATDNETKNALKSVNGNWFSSAFAEQFRQSFEVPTGAVLDASLNAQATSALRLALIEKYCTQRLETAPVKNIGDAKLPSSFLNKTQPAIKDNQLTASGFALAAAAYLKNLGAEYKEAIKLANGDEAAIKAIDKAFSKHLRAQADCLENVTVQPIKVKESKRSRMVGDIELESMSLLIPPPIEKSPETLQIRIREYVEDNSINTSFATQLRHVQDSVDELATEARKAEKAAPSLILPGDENNEEDSDGMQLGR